MKKITFLLVFAIFGALTFSSYAQTLDQAATWPNAGWTLSGTYTAGALLSDPTTTGATLTWDDDAAGNGTADTIEATSPVIDLTAASGAGETWITVSGDYVYRALGGDVLAIEVYDADAMTWSALETFVGNSTNLDFQTCASTAAYTTAVLDISGFTATQLSGFQYRISYDDQGGWQWGWCLTSPTITSAVPPTCFDPTALTATNIDGFSADLGWTEAGSATSWNIELVDITNAGTATGVATASGVVNPYNQVGLTPSNDYEFYVQADCGVDGTSTWVGPFAFSTTVACAEPSALTATNITTSGADLSWTAGAAETLWNVELVDITAAGVPTGTATASGVGNPYNVTGLTDSNNYEFYVQADCGVNGTSLWVGPFAFSTTCTAFTAPYTEDFETFTTGTAAFEAENCWTATGGTYYWESAPGTDAGSGETGPDPTITTGNYFYTEASGGLSGDTTDLVSPLVDLTALTAPALTFNYHMFGAVTGTLDVLVNGTTNVFTISGEQQASATTPWELAVIDLAAYTGQTISITIRATSAGTYEGDMAIDNVSFDELPACPLPNVLTATTITDTTVELGWTENGSATTWDIEIVDVTAMGTATGTATASGVTNPYSATGLAENNDYSFYVRSDCGGETSDWAGPFAFSTLETCPAPAGLTATAITEITAELGWTENGTATSWNIELVDITAGGVATGTATASGVVNPYAATGLVGDNSYEFYVQADCGVDGASAWAGPFVFATPYVAVDPSCSNGIFLDSGGVSGTYSSSESITYTITPDNAGDVVSVEFTFFSTENNGASACWDGLTIHNGADATATTIDPPSGGTIWCWDRNDSPAVGTGDLQGMIITSTDASGALTFVFTSDGSVTRDGWEAVVSCNTLNVNQFEDSTAFTYFPNPVKNTLTLNAQNEMSNVSVINMLGQEVLTMSPNNVDSVIDMSELQLGVYFVNVTINNTTETIRVIKQ
ncbi:T9SS type A sorting domain-containing protein [Psychroserpens luteus]|uniref:T9SS type A sorting domain-containing protein n=1 Tax=Psychroserpens luteus TaxID=1434066 RepID=A0ABW5ZYA0_9FLAO|nr:T9SS type A sorting domain-containing protein [Psychroserpens luteus]